jgi:hypothetical protein
VSRCPRFHAGLKNRVLLVTQYNYRIAPSPPSCLSHQSSNIQNNDFKHQIEPRSRPHPSTKMASTTTTPSPPTCTTAIPDKNGYVPPSACNANYGFYPSWEWNLTLTIAFGLTTLVHLVQMFILAKACPSRLSPPSTTPALITCTDWLWGNSISAGSS